MQDHSDFARQGDLRSFCTSPLGDIHRPAFELREPRYARQQNIGGFIQRRAHHLVAGPRDPAGDVLFSRLIFLWREAEQRPCGLRLRDAIGIIHRRFVGYCNQWADARHRHQSPTDRVVTNDREHSLVQLFVSAFNATRAESIAPAMRSKVAWPVTNSRIRASNPLRVTGPTFRPKPRRIPRMLNSTSISRPRSCLRATSSARTSCDLIDLACTGRNQPIRISWASPRASLRSVFTVIADNAAFTCRVSSRTASNPARFNPACSHCDNGPASSPIRFTAKPSPSKKATRAAGSLEIFASSQSYPARPQRKRSTIPMTRRFLHSVPWLSSVSRCLGPTQGRDPVSSSIGGQPPSPLARCRAHYGI